jgi:hypothetical protein
LVVAEAAVVGELGLKAPVGRGLAQLGAGDGHVTQPDQHDRHPAHGVVGDADDPAREHERRTLFMFLALQWGGPGWAVIAAIGVLASAVSHPAARAAGWFLERSGAALAGSGAQAHAATW